MPDPAHLEGSLRHRLGPLRIDLTLTLRAPWTTILGASGSGKSTLLRAIAGLVQPGEGHLLHGPEQQVLLDTRRRISLPPHLRPVRMAGQTARLVPHQSVQENLAFVLDQRGQDSSGRTLLGDALDLFGLGPMRGRMPRELSGGEAQRVSVARAVLAAADLPTGAHPLLLLDEPFSGLNPELRDRLAPGLAHWLAQRRIHVLSVSHDLLETFLLSVEVIRLEAGRIAAQGPAATVLAEDRRRALDVLSGRNGVP